MPTLPLIDTLGLEVSPGERPPLGAVLLRTIAINQLIALPIGLAMTAGGGRFAIMLVIATVYSQLIGLTCSVVSWINGPRLRLLEERKRRALLTAQYFLCGAAGAEIARRVSPWIVGAPTGDGSPVVSWAIGATVALMVGVILMTLQQLRTRVVSTEIEALQARINPHFLFNTLNSIAALIREDPQRAEAMTLHLSSLFRYTLQAPRRGLVTFEEEMTIVEGYLAIEQERLGSRLRYRLDLNESLLQVRIPALTVQPLVENAVKHGVANAVEGGEISVKLEREGDRIVARVIDTGGETDGTGGTGEGLENVRKRLQATFGRSATVALHRGDRTTEARVTFPYTTQP